MMKNTWIIAVLVALSFVGCQPRVQNLDVKQDQLSQKTNDWDILVKHAVFSSPDPEVDKSCQELNGEIQKYVNGLMDMLKTEATLFFKTCVTDSMPRPSWGYELLVKDSVFMATDQFVSVQLVSYAFTGGNHGMTNFHSFNYDVKRHKLLLPGEIVNCEDSVAINNLLKANFKNPENCFNVVPTLDLVSTLNVTLTEVCFTYAHYVLGAYACGPAQITIPRAELKNTLFVP